MKRIGKPAVAVLLLILLGGCWDRTELNDLAVVTALALDMGENNQIRTTIQVIIPQNQGAGGMMGGGGTGGGAARRTTIRSEQGSNIADALSKLQRKMPRKLFWGQCKIFVFSETLAKAGIREQFDFLVRHPQPRERAYMFVSKGLAAEALELFPPIERSSAEVMRKLSDLQIGIRVTLEQLSQMLKGEARSAMLPLIYILPKAVSAEPYQTIPYIFGTAIFKKDKMVGEISEKVTRGVMWIKNEIKEYTVTYKIGKEEGFVSLKPVKARVRMIPEMDGNQWRMTIKVYTEGDLVQNGTVLDPMDPNLLKSMEESFANDVTERIRLALREAQERLKVDMFGFATEYYRKYPKQWEAVKDHWDDTFPDVKVKVEVEAHILRPGLINTPGGMPEEEVTKQ
ncbi:Ger(x)C family spore germination protein [Paenibacillus sp. H1-7]|uniref:Ger(x)C family spore germination protein n=1 Tax=Paenibacillus sp. H1-7 TaxID=2282849 RepID=UPI001EF790FA|nr:Ger(x)C family spore germination protein [Paenibacillus sp. H1-7]ULL13176.1 Ger(x)C family spore germination protein [Paenibacillus sp. H1-7]